MKKKLHLKLLNQESKINQRLDIKLQDTYYVSKFDHPQNEIDKLSNFLVFMDQHP